MKEITRTQNKVFGYLFFIWFQMIGAVLCGFANNWLMVGWCTGWTVYALLQLEKLAKRNNQNDNMDIGG